VTRPKFDPAVKAMVASDRLMRKFAELLKNSPEAGYFHLGYGTAQVLASCDLGEAAGGLIGFYKISKYKPVLDDSIGLAKFFLTEYRTGSTEGVWSSTLGTWPLGTWEGGGGEHTTNQLGNRSGWGWSTFVVGEFLMRLHPHVEDAALQREIGDKCVRVFRRLPVRRRRGRHVRPRRPMGGNGGGRDPDVHRSEECGPASAGCRSGLPRIWSG
jgi:hypothetical protein